MQTYENAEEDPLMTEDVDMHDMPPESSDAEDMASEPDDEPERDAPQEPAPASPAAPSEGPAPPAEGEKKKKAKRAPQEVVRYAGKSVFPVSRVQKILKADKELPMVSKEAVLLISLATEEFIMRISEASHRLAARDKRATVQRKDIASVCRRVDEFSFLDEIIPLVDPTAEPKGSRKPKALQEQEDADRLPTMLDQFITKPKDVDESQPDDIDGSDYLMNEDGTMSFGARQLL